MNRLIARLRWRLARRIAPAPIMADPFPGDGSFIVTRSGGSNASVRVETLSMSISHNLENVHYDALPGYLERQLDATRTGTFSGTIG